MRLSVDEWELLAAESLPAAYSVYQAHARLAEDFELGGTGHLLFVAAGQSSNEWPDVVVALRYDPGPDAGFQPGVLILGDTKTLFVGAGTRLLAYDLQAAQRLWVDEADTGFWGWKRHGDVVVMSAELELAAWTATGRKLWTTFVEPPWTYEVQGYSVHLDVMGTTNDFDLVKGPR